MLNAEQNKSNLNLLEIDIYINPFLAHFIKIGGILYTDLSGLSNAGTCEILVTKCTTKSCDLPYWSIQSCIN